jgi:hypothetical protein
MSLAIVHRASPRVVDTVLERFHERGIEAVALDEPNVIALAVSFGTYRVRIAVPEEQADEARRVLAEWDVEVAPRLDELSHRMRRQFLLATAVTLGLGAVLWAAGVFAERLHWLLLLLLPVWFVLLLAFGAWQRARERAAERG